MTRGAAFLAVALAAVLLHAADSGAEEELPPAPVGLEVVGGDGWRDQSSWDLRWTNPVTGGAPIAAVHYRVSDAGGAIVVPDVRIDWPAEALNGLQIPLSPGVYSFELWLEDASEAEGPTSTVQLRYDNRAPSPAAPRPMGWAGRNDFPYTIRVIPPAQPFPISGIRGYAVSIDGLATGEPCAGRRLCTEMETDLRGGPSDTSYAVAGLPEGINYVHVAAVSGAGVRSAPTGHASLKVDTTPPVTRLEGAPDGWSNRPVTLTVRASDPAGSVDGSASGVAQTAIRLDDRAPLLSAGESATVSLFESGIHRIVHYARDVAANANDGAAANGVENPPPSTALVRIDREPPTVSFRAWQDPDDPELIVAGVVDSLSGPSGDRGSIEFRPAGSEEPFHPLATIVHDGVLRARWPSDAQPPGEYEFQAVGFDSAGNEAGARMLLTAPLKAPTVLLAGFGGERLTLLRCVRRFAGRRCKQRGVFDFGSRPRRRVVDHGRRVAFGGRLTSRAGTPVAGAPVRVLEDFEGGRRRRVSLLATDAQGRFSLRLARGPNREVAASFPGTAELAGSTSARVRLGVRTKVRFNVSAPTATVGGRPVVFSGRVVGAPRLVSEVGKAVSLQFRLPGLEWAEFRALRTDSRGRFRYRYRFADDDSRGIRFQFRAYAPPQTGWPYEPAGSPPIFVRGI